MKTEPGKILTYDEVVAALREAERLGDCVPEDIEGTARAIIDGRLQQPNVQIRTMSDFQPPPIDDIINALKTFATGPWGSKSDVVRREVEKVVVGLQPDDVPGAIGNWVEAHVRFLRDPALGETIPTPEYLMDQIVERGHCDGDGDDIAALVAAMALSIGLEAQFMVVGLNGKPPSHVFARVKNLEGAWVAIDPVAGKIHYEKHVTTSQIFPIEETPQ